MSCRQKTRQRQGEARRGEAAVGRRINRRQTATQLPKVKKGDGKRVD